MASAAPLCWWRHSGAARARRAGCRRDGRRGLYGKGERRSRPGKGPGKVWCNMAKQGDMTVREAGKRGGETVKKKYGLGFYAEIGKKGGSTVAAERGREFYSEIGKKGGQAVKDTRGQEFYSEIGR